MKPAYHISLTAPEKRVIAEIAAIQTQIDWIIRITVQRLLDVSPATAQRIVGSTVLKTNAEIWIKVVREKHRSHEARQWAELAFAETAAISKGRNDFLHTLFGIEGNPETGPVSFLLGHTKRPLTRLRSRKAIRASTSKEVDLSSLYEVRNEAAHLSCVFAHVEWLTHIEERGRSPWQGKLSKERLVRFQNEELQRASVRERQRATSLK